MTKLQNTIVAVALVALLPVQCFALELTDGLKAAYLSSHALPAADAAALDDSGSGAHLRLQGAVLGPFRDRIELDGAVSGPVVYMGDAGSEFDVFNTVAESFTLSMLVTLSSGNTSKPIIFNTGDTTATTRAIELYYNVSSGKAELVLDGGATAVVHVGSAMTVGTEHYVTVRYDQANLWLDVDAAQTTEAFAGPLDDNNGSGYASRFGERWNGTEKLKGTIREIKLWHRVLTDAEVTASEGWMPPLANRGVKNVAILIGQSNGSGIESSASLTAQPHSLNTPHGLIADGRAPVTSLRTVLSDGGETAGFMGVEVSLSQSLGEDWAIIKYVQSDTGIFDDWAPAGATWLAAKAHIKEQLKELSRLGYTLGKVIVVDVRGEKDSRLQVNADAYQANWDAHHAEVRATIGKAIGWVQSRMSNAQTEPLYVYKSTIQAAQDAIAAADPQRRRVVNTDALTVVPGNVAHYDADSIRSLGFMLGDEVKRLAATMSDETASSLELTATQSAITIQASDNAAAGGLRFDTIDTTTGNTNSLATTIDTNLDAGATANTTRFNTIDSSVGALPNAAAINAEVDTALADYDGPTRTELTTDTNSVIAAVSASVATVTAEDIDERYTFRFPRSGSATTASNYITVGAGFAGAIQFELDGVIDADTTIATVTSVAVSGSGGTTANNRVDTSKRKVLTDLSSVSTPGTYTVTLTVTTADSYTLVVTGSLVVE